MGLTVIINCYYSNNGAIIIVIMDALLPNITRSIMGNNGFHYDYYPLLPNIARSIMGNNGSNHLV